jgi:hypothetical protein
MHMEKTNAIKVMYRNADGKRQLERYRLRRKDNID